MGTFEVAEGDRITVSTETLRAELAQLELRLYDRLSLALAQKADLAHIEQLETRVQSLELSRASRESHAKTLGEHAVEIERLKRWRYGFPSLALVGLALSAVAVYLAYFT